MKSRKVHHYVRPLIDRKNTNRIFVDLNSFLRVVFPNNELHQRIALNILEYLSHHKSAYLLRDVIPFIQTETRLTHTKITNPKGPKGTGKDERVKIVSKDTIAKVFKMMWKSGLTAKPYRYSPISMSKTFASRLRNLAEYWENYVEQYG
ncbi:MAG: hypothetical protein NWE91_01915 [Candidatus Bathyarchaeota archaeon]|nr:hypothetical protein [Candidatus Bathyarchaeota archaeon]